MRAHAYMCALHCMYPCSAGRVALLTVRHVLGCHTFTLLKRFGVVDGCDDMTIFLV
jgi:hypothetical protein